MELALIMVAGTMSIITIVSILRQRMMKKDIVMLSNHIEAYGMYHDEAPKHPFGFDLSAKK